MSRRGVSAVISALALVFALVPPLVAYAEPQSTNFRFDESAIGAGGFVQSASTSYRADTATGDLGVGNSSSSNFQVEAGSKTTHEPTLSITIGPASNFAPFSASTASMTTSTFTVSNYTSYGYVVQIAGNTPSNGNYALPALASTASSSVGTEQFGLNLVANTSPSSIGANPNQGQFGFGVASANYSTPNQFRYVSGETIASAPRSSGVTTFTISYLINVDSLTPGGRYSSNQQLIVTGTY